MLKLFDFVCDECGSKFEELTEVVGVPCPECGTITTHVAPNCAKSFETIRATSLTSKTYKAGWAHLRNRPATKIQSQVPGKR